MKRNERKISFTEIKKCLLKLPVEQRRVLLRRAQFKLIRGGRA